LLVQNVSKISSDLGYFIAFMFQLMFEALNLKVKSGKSVYEIPRIVCPSSDFNVTHILVYATKNTYE
jgi:hypothetical protein